MAEMNRRKFLLASAGVGAAGLLAGTAAVTWPEVMRAAREHPLADGSGILVVVTLYGGNDGINTVIPYADPAYHDMRPELAYAASDVLRLDDHLGLNPGMKGLAKLWGQKQLALIRGVGYPRPDHSHFRSMDIWQTASPDEPVSTGWIGRWLDNSGGEPLRAINIGAVLPPLMVGEKSTAAALLTGAAKSSPSDDVLTALGADDPHDSRAMAMVCASYRAARTADAQLAHLGRGASEAPEKSSGTGGPRTANPLATQLDMVARCITSGVPAPVYAVQLGGFDTHADERGTQQRLLTTLDTAVSGFLDRMGNDPHGKNVVLMAYSEFGRRVAANASHGTDHGTAGPVLVAGAPVKGGFYGDEPSLTDLDNGDLKVTTDFRDVYNELLATTVSTDPVPVVGTGRRDLGFLRAQPS
jgi:uncharacterized protein (DUF1501 family)